MEGRKRGREKKKKKEKKERKESTIGLSRAIIIKKSTVIQSNEKSSDFLKLHWSHFWSQNLK